MVAVKTLLATVGRGLAATGSRAAGIPALLVFVYATRRLRAPSLRRVVRKPGSEDPVERLPPMRHCEFSRSSYLIALTIQIIYYAD
jgi:hypothetical protein